MTSDPRLLLCGGELEIGIDSALRMLVGYAFARRDPIHLDQPIPRYTEDEGDVVTIEPFVWAYRTFDCVPASAEDRLTLHDLFVTDGLNAGLAQQDAAAFLEVADSISEQLPAADDPPFWDLPIERFSRGGAEPERSTDPRGHLAWRLGRAWYLTARIPGFKITRVHKVLHHKRPRHFPLLDNETAGFIRARQGEDTDLWVAVQQDLSRNSELFALLEDRFAASLDLHRAGPFDPPLLRLRIHDILLWLHARNQDALADQLGARLI